MVIAFCIKYKLRDHNTLSIKTLQELLPNFIEADLLTTDPDYYRSFLIARKMTE
jgi:hypothetical protein